MVIPVTKPKVSSSEKKYRLDLFPDVKEIKNKNLLCTSCGGSVKELITKGRPIIHPFLETLLCEKCYSFYGDGQFSVDEDGSDKYCRWCGQGGTLFLCSSCTSGFCKRCVKRNLPKTEQAKIEKDDWLCYCCDTLPLYELRAQCWAAQQYAAELVKNKGSLKNKKSSKENNKRSRSSESSGSDVEIQSKKKLKEKTKKKVDKKGRNGEEKEGSGGGGGGGRLLRKRAVNKQDSGDHESVDSDVQSDPAPELVLPSGISYGRMNAAIDKMSSVVVDVAGATKEAHKKLLECKNKKLNIDNIYSVETVFEMHSKLISMIMSLETNLQAARNDVQGFVEEWSKMVLDDLKVVDDKKEKEASESTDDTDRLENGLPSDSQVDSYKNNEAENDDTEAMEVDKTEENKEIESDEENKENESDEQNNINVEKKVKTKESDGTSLQQSTVGKESASDNDSEQVRIPATKDREEKKPKESNGKVEGKESMANAVSEELSRDKPSTVEITLSKKSDTSIKES